MWYNSDYAPHFDRSDGMAADDSPLFFGDWLKRRRQGLDLTQAELAARAGCSIFALRKIETGERRPSSRRS